jgi:hypothetical protein
LHRPMHGVDHSPPGSGVRVLMDQLKHRADILAQISHTYQCGF